MHQKHLSFRLNKPSAIPRQCTQNRREGRKRNIAEGKKTPPELIPKHAQTARAEPMYSRGTSRSRRRRRPGWGEKMMTESLVKYVYVRYGA